MSDDRQKLSPSPGGQRVQENTTARLPELVTAEIRVVCRGRGLLAPDLGDRVGTLLFDLAALNTIPPGPDRRRVLAAWLEARAEALPDDLRLAARVALGLERRARHRYLGDRLGWLAEQLSRDQRTVRRRVDEALRLLGESALATASTVAASATSAAPASSDGSSGSWYSERVRALVRLDLSEPEVIEYRRVVSVADQLNLVVLAVSLPRPFTGSDTGRSLSADVLFGGILVGQEHPSESYFRFFLRLPRPLRRQERHDFALRLRVPPGQAMASRYAFIPMARCDELRVRVRFPLSNPAVRLWVLDGIPPRTADDAPDSLSEVTLDGVGEASATFVGLSVGLGYGFRWEGLGDTGLR